VARRDWDKAKTRQHFTATTRAEVDARSYTRDINESRRSRHQAPAPHPTKAELRAEGAAAVEAWQEAHPAPAPWGPWTPWRTVTRPDGTTYQERDRRRL
jgi:hypothetical protein